MRGDHRDRPRAGGSVVDGLFAYRRNQRGFRGGHVKRSWWLRGAAALAALAVHSSVLGAQQYDLLVTSRETNSVKRYDGDTGQYVDDFLSGGGLSGTQEVAIGPDGHFYVSGIETTDILKFDRRSGAFLGNFTSGYSLDRATKMTFGPDGYLYVSQWGQARTAVARFDATTGAFTDEATPPLTQGMGHAWDADGTLHVVSFGTRDVRRYDETGAFIDVFTSGKSLQGPVNVWFGADGDLMVIDWEVGTVERFDGVTGVFKSTFVSGMTRAEGWAFGPVDGDLYVADWAQDVVNRYDGTTGSFVERFAQGGGLGTPNGLLFIERLPEFTLDVAAASDIVEEGVPADLEVVVAAARGVPFLEPVTLGCASLPTGSTCSFDTEEVVPGETSATATLTITMSNAAGSSQRAGPWALAAAVLLVGAIAGASSRSSRLAVAVALSGLVVASCGDGPTPPETEDRVVTFNVTGEGDGISRSELVRLTVSAR